MAKFKYRPPLARRGVAEIRVNGTTTPIRFTAYPDGDFETDDATYLGGMNGGKRVGSDIMAENADILRDASAETYRVHRERAREEYEVAAERAADEHRDRRPV